MARKEEGPMGQANQARQAIRRGLEQGTGSSVRVGQIAASLLSQVPSEYISNVGILYIPDDESEEVEITVTPDRTEILQKAFAWSLAGEKSVDSTLIKLYDALYDLLQATNTEETDLSQIAGVNSALGQTLQAAAASFPPIERVIDFAFGGKRLLDSDQTALQGLAKWIFGKLEAKNSPAIKRWERENHLPNTMRRV